jgi:pyruvate kinase
MNKNFLNKKTKIVCTIGPASNTEEMITKLIDAGMDIARMNFSHSTHSEHKKVFEAIRICEQRAGRPIGILADLQGPKIRTGVLKDGPFDLIPGDTIYLNTQPDFLGTREEISTVYTNIINDVEIGHKVLIDDGKIVLIVKEKKNGKLLLETLVGGKIKDKKGINLPGSPVSAPALSDKDIDDLKFAVSLGVDFIALSFVRKPEDLNIARSYIKDSFINLIVCVALFCWILTK